MHIERMMRAAEILEAFEETPSRAFIMCVWFKQFRQGSFSDLSECGTAQCAAGIIAQDPWMNEQGLTLARQPSREGRSPKYGDLFAFEALGDFFKLDYDQTRLLFASDAYYSRLDRLSSGSAERVTPRTVAARIRGMTA